MDLSGSIINNVVSPYTLNGLKNRSPHSIQIKAFNSSGMISPATTISVTPIPDLPTLYTNIVTDISNHSLHSFTTTDETTVLAWIYSDTSANAILRIYSPPDFTNKMVTDPLQPFMTMEDVSGQPTLTLIDLSANTSYYILSEEGDYTFAMAIQSYTGTALPLTLIKTGTLNDATGLIMTSNTDLDVFTINGFNVEDGDTLTIRNRTTVPIVVVPSDPDATVVVDAETIVEGSNTVTVTVTASDCFTTVTRTVTLNAIFNSISETTSSEILSLQPNNMQSITAITTGLLTDLSNDPESQIDILTSFLDAIGIMALPTQVDILMNVASNLSSITLKQILNQAFLDCGVQPNVAYPLSATVLPILTDAIPAVYSTLSPSLPSLSLTVPDITTNDLIIDLANPYLLLSMIPDHMYTLSAEYSGTRSTNMYSIIYKREETGRYLVVDGDEIHLDSQIPFSFSNSGRRYIQLKAFGSPIVESGLIPPIAIQKLTLTPDSVSLRIGQRGILNVQMIPNLKASLVWSSSSACVTVNQIGSITAISRGSAVISATTADESMTVTCSVQVAPN